MAPWLSGLINDGIVGGVGAVLGFVPQMLLLFLMLSLLEQIGYMARVAFVLDRVSVSYTHLNPPWRQPKEKCRKPDIRPASHL